MPSPKGPATNPARGPRPRLPGTLGRRLAFTEERSPRRDYIRTNHLVNIRKKCRFRPDMESLDRRVLLSGGITASVSRGVLTINRDDASDRIYVEVRTPAVRENGRVAGLVGAVVVQGVGRFPMRRISSITINPGSSDDNIVINVPAHRVIPLRINAPETNPAPPEGRAAVAPPASKLSAPTPIPATVRVAGGVSALEQQVFDLVNAERVRAGVAPLLADTRLTAAAQIHGRNMAALDLMAHELPGVAQPTLASRAHAVGYDYGWLGENIASGYGDAPSVVAAWMASPGHRANILNAKLTASGVGIGRDSQGDLFICQEFASPA